MATEYKVLKGCEGIDSIVLVCYHKKKEIKQSFTLKNKKS